MFFIYISKLTLNSLMKKIINFSEKQIKFIETLCKEFEISFTEMVKRIVDEFIEKQKEKNS